MATKEEVLREKTHKGDGIGMGERIFYTLKDEEPLQATRTAKIIALLVAKLSEQGVISEEYVDDLMFEVVS
jgi:hypothetical protein